MPQKWPAQKRLDLIAFVESGLSCRQAAVQVGVSAATAVRWTQGAGLISAQARRLAPPARAALRKALCDGASPTEAAAKFHVSRSTAARLAPRRGDAREPMRKALCAAVDGGLSRRQAAVALGLSVATAIRWARNARPSREGPPVQPSRLARPPRFRADRESKRAQLLEAIDSGLSRRKAAAELGLPVATAIRWASSAGRRPEP
jgi:transposase